MDTRRGRGSEDRRELGDQDLTYGGSSLGSRKPKTRDSPRSVLSSAFPRFCQRAGSMVNKARIGSSVSVVAGGCERR